MSKRNAPHFEVEVRPGFGLLLVTLVLVNALFNWSLVLRQVPGATPWEALNWGAGVTLLVLLGTVVHELGHVLVGALAGHRWVKAVLNGAGMGVVIEPTPIGWERVARSVGGPVAQLLAAAPLFLVAALTAPQGLGAAPLAVASVWWVGAMSNVFLACFNLLPLPGTDGLKAARGLREVRRAHRRLELASEQG